MQEREAAMMMQAGVVESVVLFGGGQKGWSVHIYGDTMPASLAPQLETARGGMRTFATLDAAFRLVCQIRGRAKFPVSVDGSTL